MSCCTAMMSARGTMTSSTRRSRRPRMFRSMAAFARREPDLAGAGASSTPARSARIESGFQPNSARSAPREPAFAVRRAISARRHRHRQVARSLGWRAAGSPDGWTRSVSGMAISVSPRLRARRRDRARRAARGSCARAAPSSSASRVGLVIIAQQMQKAMDDEMREMMAERLALGGRLARDGLDRRSRCRRIADRRAAAAPAYRAAGNDSTLVGLSSRARAVEPRIARRRRAPR